MESAHDPRMLIGVGDAKTARVVVRWPSGETSTLSEVATNSTLKIREPGERAAP